MKTAYAFLALVLLAPPALALELHVQGVDGRPLPLVMATVTPAQPRPVDRSDYGYAQPGKRQIADLWQTAFSDATGSVHVDLPSTAPVHVRLRRPGFTDLVLDAAPTSPVVLHAETNPQELAAAKPANVWAAAVHIGTPAQDKNFRMQCGFCHQQGEAFFEG